MQQSNIVKNTSDDYSDMESIIKIMYSIGIPPLLQGYDYIQDAALMIMDDSSMVYRLNDEVYPKVASHFFTTAQRVEKAIRHAIEISWSWEGSRSLKNYYNESLEIPTNSEFLTFIDSRIKADVN